MKQQNQVMVFKIPEKMNKALSQIGELEERSKAWLIRKAVEKYLEEVEKKRKNGDNTSRK